MPATQRKEHGGRYPESVLAGDEVAPARRNGRFGNRSVKKTSNEKFRVMMGGSVFFLYLYRYNFTKNCTYVGILRTGHRYNFFDIPQYFGEIPSQNA